MAAAEEEEREEEDEVGGQGKAPCWQWGVTTRTVRCKTERAHRVPSETSRDLLNETIIVCAAV